MKTLAKYWDMIQPEPDTQTHTELLRLEELESVIAQSDKQVEELHEQRAALSQFEVTAQARVDKQVSQAEREKRLADAEARQLRTRLDKQYEVARMERQAANLLSSAGVKLAQ